MFSDQFVSSAEGWNQNSHGQSLSTNSYFCWTVFCDADSGYLSIHHQVGFTSAETIVQKLAFEKKVATVSVNIKNYTTNNRVWTVKAFTLELEENQQTISLSEVGANHLNGIISCKGTIMMFHILWPLGKVCMVHLCNHTPRRQDCLFPVEL